MTGPQGIYGMGRFHGRIQGAIAMLLVGIGIWLWIKNKEQNSNIPHLN